MNSISAVRFDQKISNIEDFLSTGAAVPVAGTIPGLVKVALGAIQLVGATFALLWSAISKDASLQERAWTHMKHGAGNMVAGTFEAIPVVGTIVGAIRLHRGTKSFIFSSSQHSKFMPYESIMEHDSRKVSRDGPLLPRSPIPRQPAQPVVPGKA